MNKTTAVIKYQNKETNTTREYYTFQIYVCLECCFITFGMVVDYFLFVFFNKTPCSRQSLSRLSQFLFHCIKDMLILKYHVCRSVKGLCYSIKILTVKVCTSFSLQYSSLIVIGIDGDTRPPLLLVTMGTLPGRAEPGGVGVVVDAGCGCCIFFLLTFLSLARRFWNQIFTCQQHAMSHTEKHFL